MKATLTDPLDKYTRDPSLSLAESGVARRIGVERLIEESVADALREAGAVVATAKSGSDQGYDLLIPSTSESVAVAIEVGLWRYISKNLRNRISEGLAKSVRVRRGFAQEVKLVYIAVIELAPGSRAATADWIRMRDLLRRPNSDAGYDRVYVGFSGGEESKWYSLEHSYQVEHAGFDAIATEIVNAQSPILPVSSDIAAGPTKFLLVSDEWTSHSGGISTFNREFAIALAAAGCVVHVAVPAATETERDDASSLGVTLVIPDPLIGVEGTQLLLSRPRVESISEVPYEPNVVVGHGRILGPYAHAIRALHYPEAKGLHIVHTDAEPLEHAKEEPNGPSRASIAEERRLLELNLALSSHLVAGVGPLLAKSIEGQMRGARGDRPKVIELQPGLRNWDGHADPSDPPPKFQVLLLGRGEDSLSKGLDIGVAATIRARALMAATWRGDVPQLVVRGVPEMHADEVNSRLKRQAAPNIEVFLRPYSTDQDSLRMDLFQSSVVIMPSRHEGFGLAAFEAIAAGVPVLIGQNSGLAELLVAHFDDGSYSLPPEIVPVDGMSDTEIADEWGKALARVLSDKPRSFARAKFVRESLASRISWPQTVERLLEELAVDSA